MFKEYFIQDEEEHYLCCEKEVMWSPRMVYWSKLHHARTERLKYYYLTGLLKILILNFIETHRSMSHPKESIKILKDNKQKFKLVLAKRIIIAEKV